MSNESTLLSKILNVILEGNFKDIIANGTDDESINELRLNLESLAKVQAKLIATYLMRLSEDGKGPEVVAESADQIVDIISQYMDDQVTHELAYMAELLTEILESKGQTSH